MQLRVQSFAKNTENQNSLRALCDVANKEGHQGQLLICNWASGKLVYTVALPLTFHVLMTGIILALRSLMTSGSPMALCSPTVNQLLEKCKFL